MITTIDAAQTVTVHRLAVPGAALHYERRGSGPAVLLVGNPMDATWFAPLAELLATGHTVLTTDPRGIHRSPIHSEADVSAETRAADLAAILIDAAVGPATVVGSSGGAVSALALAQAFPELVATVVAHEPPLEELLDDHIARRAATDDIIDTYLRGDIAGAWGKFLAEAHIADTDQAREQGPMLPPDADPQAVADERFFFSHLLRPTTRWVPDIARLRQLPTRVVVAIGEASTGQVCDLTSRRLADLLGIDAAIYPGDHLGFVMQPVPFAARLIADLHA